MNMVSAKEDAIVDASCGFDWSMAHLQQVPSNAEWTRMVCQSNWKSNEVWIVRDHHATGYTIKGS